MTNNNNNNASKGWVSSETTKSSARQGIEHALRWQFLQILEVLFGDDVDQEIEDLGIVDAGGNIAFLNPA